jgi:hypothetical protein
MRMRQVTSRSGLGLRAAVLGLLLLASGPEGALGATPVQKCTAVKTKAFGVAVKGKAQCQAKARRKEALVDAACLAKAEAKLEKRFTKADAIGACPGDLGAAQTVTSQCVTDLDGATTGDAGCSALKIKAAGKKAAGKSACAKTAAIQGTTVDPACLAKVETKFAKAMAKADRLGACTGTAQEIEALVDACVLPLPIACTGGTGYSTCDGTCPDGLTCRPYEVFESGASVETGCSCVDMVQGIACGGAMCGPDEYCADPMEVCERWFEGDPLGCDHTICQPALTTPTTLPPAEMTACGGGEFPTCGGTCPTGTRCQAFQALLDDITLFAGCLCVDPTAPRCDDQANCDLNFVPATHCADPTKVCLVTLGGTGEMPVCAEAHCGDALPVVMPTTTTSTSTSTTTTTSTSTTTTLPCVSTPGTSGCFMDLGDCTILDGCTGLQWEEKTTTPGRHDVDSRHPWAGRCNGDPTKLCQPDAAAAATCAAHAEGGTYGCDECAVGETCVVEVDGVPTTTAWGWIDQLNAENFAGHTDWRLPREAGISPTGDRELESILLMPSPCATSPCIDPIFGPTAPDLYWSATTTPANADDTWFVNFADGGWGNDGKRNANRVRAVR